jgi:hypothetical protein
MVSTRAILLLTQRFLRSYDGLLVRPVLDLASMCNQLRRLCLRRATRQTTFTKDRPSDWRPQSVVDPRPDAGGAVFTDAGAWDYIVELLDAGQPVSTITLDQPRGRTGFVMKVDCPDGRQLYIKLQLGTGMVIGRSFHYSQLRGVR